MNPKPTREAKNYFCKALLTLKTEREAADFLNCICTPLEINTFSQRLEVAKLLHRGEVYLDIVAETTASTATISRVKRSMEADPETYEKLFDRMGEQ
jgi:TrpR-related protein YerC/YecD